MADKKWKKTPLKNLCVRIGDGLHGTPNYTTKSDFFFINGNNLKKGKIIITKDTKTITESDYKNNYIELNRNSLLLSINGTIGNMAFYNGEKVMLGKSSAYLNFKTEINKFYYYYFQLKGVQDYFYNVATGSTIKNLSLESIQNFEVPVPDENEWKNIASILSSLDAKIELNNKINAELEAMAKILYDYWFVQYDFPISAEQAAAMGKPNLQGKPYKSSGGKMVYNQELKREIPEGWEVKELAEWIEKDKSGDWGKEAKQGNYTEKVSCIRGTDINGLNGKGEVKAPIRYILEKNSNKILEPNELIVEISGGSPTQSTGRLGYITKGTLERFDNPLICSNFCKAISLKDSKQLFYFVFLWNSIYENDILFGWEGKTSGIKNLLFDSFINNYKAVDADKKLVEKFNAFIKPIHSKMQKNLQENQQLTELRDWLLPMLMNGQVTVRQAHGKPDNLDMAAEEKENII